MKKFVIENLVELYKSLNIVDGGQFFDNKCSKTTFAIKTKSNEFFLNFALEESKEQISEKWLNELISFYKGKDFCLWINPDEKEKMKLTELGFIFATPAILTSHYLDPIHFNNIDQDDFLIQETKLKDFDNWYQVFSTSFGYSKEVGLFMKEWHEKMLKSNYQSSWKLFHLIYENKYVAVGSLFLTKEFAGLYNLAVLPEFRRRKLGNNLLKAIAKYSYEHGATALGGAAGPEGFSLYQNYPLDTFGEMEVWLKFREQN